MLKHSPSLIQSLTTVRGFRWIRIGKCLAMMGWFLGIVTLCLHPTQAAPKAAAPKAKEEPNPRGGFKFPAFKAPYLQIVPGQPFKPKVMDFGQMIGKKPFVMFYFLPQHKASVTELKAFAAASMIFKGKLEFLAVTKAQNKEEVVAAYRKLKELKITLPLLLDQRGLLAYVMLTSRVPSYALITQSGYLRLARASQLTEQVTPQSTLLGVLAQAAKGEDINFIRAPGYTPNPNSLVSKAAPRFALPHALSQGNYNLDSVVGKKRPTLLVFWSVTCPHCQKTLPVLEKYAQEHAKDFRTISVVIAHTKERKTQLKTFLDKHGIKSLVLNDEKGEVFNKYLIMTVPTLFLVTPKGNISGVQLGGGEKVGKEIDELLAYWRKHRHKEAKQPTPRPAAPPASRRTAPRPASRPSK